MPSRQVPEPTITRTKADLRYNVNAKKGYTVAKAVTTWYDDITYNETQEYVQINHKGETLTYEHPPLKDPYIYTLKNELMLSLSRKIDLATNINVTTRQLDSRYETRNYSLASMIVTHFDPWGYEPGVESLYAKIYHPNRKLSFMVTLTQI